MTRLSKTLLAAAAAAAVALPLAAATAAPAAADSPHVSIDIGHGWTQHPSGPLFNVSRIAPGWTTTTTLGVRNDSTQAAAVALRSAAIDDDENGCNRPESFVDTTCTGKNAGELGHELVLDVYAGTASQPAWSGSLYDLEHNAPLGTLAAHAATSYRLAMSLPFSSGNETQTDRVGFQLVVALDGATAGVAVEGSRFTRDPGGHGAVAQLLDVLPFTGTPALRLVAAALALVLLGAMTWLGGLQWRVTRPQ